MQKTIKKLLITGGSGFIGKNLVDRLAKKYEILCVVKDPSYNKSGIKIIHGDITDANFIRCAMDKIDVVVHLAAIIDTSDENIVKINVDYTRLLVEVAKASKVRKFIFISTENVLYDFKDAYSSTKRIAEKIVKESFKNYLILRPTVVYGRYEKRYVKKLVDISKKYKVLPVPGDGKKLFQPVYVDDVVKCIENGIKYDIRGEYIVAGPSKISYDYFTKMVLKLAGIKCVVFHIPTLMLKVANYWNTKVFKIGIPGFQVKSLEIDKVYDISKSTKVLKYNPTPLNVGMKKTFKFLKSL